MGSGNLNLGLHCCMQRALSVCLSSSGLFLVCEVGGYAGYGEGIGSSVVPQLFSVTEVIGKALAIG